MQAALERQDSTFADNMRLDHINDARPHSVGEDEVQSSSEAQTSTSSHEDALVLRSYQDEMLDQSLKHNSIVVLDTGAGKTHIAIARIRAELEVCESHKFAWFLAPTVALCQQHSVSIQKYLPTYQIRILSGEDNVDRWTEQTIWDAVLKNIRIVVSTHDILLDALTHGFVTMQQLALCVFDEAHHCKKSHSSNMIMQRFYYPTKTKGLPVPAILGLSASPVMNSKVGGLELLEANLDSQVVTPRLRRSELVQYVHVPELNRCMYGTSQAAEHVEQFGLYSRLWQLLDNYDMSKDPYVVDLKTRTDVAARDRLDKVLLTRSTYCLDQLKNLCRRAEVIFEYVGVSALDWYLRACSERMSKGLAQASASWMPELSEKEKQHLASVLSTVACNDTQVEHSVSPKTRLLLDILRREASASFTGIIFVEQRSVVAALAETIKTLPDTANLFNLATFVGGSNSSKRKANIGDIVEPLGQQQNLDEFRIGRKNLIIATSVLEEGIDVSSCQTVICFDPPLNLVSFVQRRGRARKEGSKFMILLKDGDAKCEPGKWNELEEKMKNAYMEELRNVQVAAELESQIDKADRQYLVGSTGALLTAANAKPHLYHFCATLLTSCSIQLKPVFSCHEDASTQSITAEVTLPAAVHKSVRKAQSSGLFKTERAAVADAAFEAYVALIKMGLVSDNLLPFRLNSTAVTNDLPGISGNMQALPRLSPWSSCFTSSQGWSSSVIDIEIGGKSQGSLWMYLPTICPPLADIILYWSASVEGVARVSNAHDHRLADPELARNSTAVLHSAVYSSIRISDEKRDFAVLFQPVDFEALTGDREALDAINEQKKPPIRPDDYGLLRVKGLMGQAFVYEHAIIDTNTVTARKFPKKRNFLHRPDSLASMKDTRLVELSLSECTMDVLPARYATAAACIPSVLHHIEKALLAQQLQQGLLKTIRISNLNLIIEATTSSAADSQHNYERLEFLGDSALKFCTHVQLSAQHPTWHEGLLTETKGRTNGNSSLAQAALRTGVHRFMNIQRFTANKWRPTYMSDVVNSTEEKVWWSSKTTADVVEALIGASFLDKGLPGALQCIRIFLPDEKWFDHDTAHEKLQYAAPVLTMPNPGLLEALIGYRFNNSALLLEATTHASFVNSESASYERLEFLGDAVIDQLIVPELYKHRPLLKNHEMHRLRQALVNSSILGFLCMELSIDQERTDVVKDSDAMTEVNGVGFESSSHTFRLPDFLRCGSETAIQRWTATSKHIGLRESVLHALQHDKEYPWPLLYELHPPKMLCDLIEAVLGAIYIDSHGSLEACRMFLERIGLLKLMQHFLDDDVELETPKVTIGILADDEKVTYETKKSTIDGLNTRLFECTVHIGDRPIATAKGCAYRDEAETKAAAIGVRMIIEERAGIVHCGKGWESGVQDEVMADDLYGQA